MCYRLIERYSVCKCLYYEHAVDRCAAYNQSGHNIIDKEIPVGYACADHTAPIYSNYGAGGFAYSDSGYHSSNSHQGGAKR